MKFCGNLKYYISCELEECVNPSVNYPVGTLGSGDNRVSIRFMHYDNFSQAKGKWDERKKRIHWDNIYFIMDTCYSSSPNTEAMYKFDALPLRNKVILTRSKAEGVKSAVRFSVPELDGIELAFMLEYKSRLSFRRNFDDWDYVSFFNAR